MPRVAGVARYTPTEEGESYFDTPLGAHLPLQGRQNFSLSAHTLFVLLRASLVRERLVTEFSCYDSSLPIRARDDFLVCNQLPYPKVARQNRGQPRYESRPPAFIYENLKGFTACYS